MCPGGVLCAVHSGDAELVETPVRTVRPQQPALRLHPHQLLPHIRRAQVHTHGLSYPSLLFLLHSFHPCSSLHYLCLGSLLAPLETLYYLSCYPLPQSTRAVLSNSVSFAPSSLSLHPLYSTPRHSPLYTLHHSTLYTILISLHSLNYPSLYFHLTTLCSLLLSPLLISHSSLHSYSYCGVG